MNTPESFMVWFRTNYPGPNTVISKPDWHAPKIYSAAMALSGRDELLEACKRAITYFERGGTPEHVPTFSALREAVAKAEGK